MLLVLPLPGCAYSRFESHVANPLGWPAKGLAGLGLVAADSGWPGFRETGRLLQALGELCEAPALLVEAVAVLDPDRVVGAGSQWLVGTGATVTATWNLPFFVMPGRNVDLGRDAGIVNQALAHLDGKGVFPAGTRVRASGSNLVYLIPGQGEVLQAAEEQWLWDLSQWAVGTNFVAQERSWGFVLRSRQQWRSFAPKARAVTILHEFYHQQMQMRAWLRGWTLVYWPAYITTFVFTGWRGHWAETEGPHAAAAVERALSNWQPRQPRQPRKE